MVAVQTTDTPNFETVWAALQETDRIFKENAIRNEKEMTALRESQAETDRQMKEYKNEFRIQIGSLTNLFGDFTVGMVIPKISEKFMELGLDFPRASKEVIVSDNRNDIFYEIDIMLENGDKAMLVEVKTKLTVERINKHIERLEKMRRYANIHGDKRTFLGAVAGFAISDEVRQMALREGFYLIEPDGENFYITPPNDKPKEW